VLRRGEGSPKDRVTGTGGAGVGGAPDLDELGRVLTHELTHHYMSMRWAGSSVAGGPGHWVIEGMATFVENQAVQMDRRGLAFNDESVANLDAMSFVAKQKMLFPAESFVDGDRGDFDKLSDTHMLTVKLRTSFGEKHYTQRGLWYDQAGAMCFFFLFKRGAEGREQFVRYVRLHYMHGASRAGWNSLGYETPEAIDKDFTAWLLGLRGG